jgi:hypothetical protein
MVLNHKIFLYLGILILLSACTVQKRLHQKGYYVAFNGNYKSLSHNKNNNSSTENKTLEINKLRPELLAETVSETTNNYELCLIDTVEIDSVLSDDIKLLNITSNHFNYISNSPTNSFKKNKSISSLQNSPSIFYHSAATFHAFIAHFGTLLILIGILLFVTSVIDLGIIIFLLLGILFNITGTIYGFRAYFLFKSIPDILPLFTKISLIIYSVFWCLIFIGIILLRIFI